MMGFLERLLFMLIWLKNFISPFLIGIILALICLHYYLTFTGKAMAVLVLAGGALSGIRLAAYLRKNTVAPDDTVPNDEAP